MIERTLTSSDYELDYLSFYVIDGRINVDTVVAIYVKAFYTGTTVAYYVPLSQWQENYAPFGTIVSQIMYGSVRLFDSDRDLQGEIVVVAVTQ